MRNRPFTLAYGVMLMLGMPGHAVAQDNGAPQLSARQQLQHIHPPSVKEGGFYGWPWFYMGGHQDPRLMGTHPELKAKVIIPMCWFNLTWLHSE